MVTVYTYSPDHTGTLVLHSARHFAEQATAELWANVMRNAGYTAEIYA
jgi:hypothetical protein